MTPIHQSPDPAPTDTRVPDGCRVYAIGDIHGRADLLRRLHRQIIEDSANATGMRKVLVYLGDYVDRGPDSAAVIDMLIDKPLEGFERHLLKGNHEAMMIDFLETGNGGEMWLMNGARDTLDSYGLGLSDIALHRDDMMGLSNTFADVVPQSHREFLNGLGLHHSEGDYLFVHAGILPGVAINDQRQHDLIWIRDEFTRSDADFGAVVVHGHTIRNEPEIKANRIGIDTGAWHSDRLTALVLETGSRRFLQT